MQLVQMVRQELQEYQVLMVLEEHQEVVVQVNQVVVQELLAHQVLLVHQEFQVLMEVMVLTQML